MKIGLVGDYNATYLAHQAIPQALVLASQHLGISVTPEWISTDTIGVDEMLSDCDGIWCVPGSPYRIFAEALTTGPLRQTAVDREGAIRGIELTTHPFFVGTLFQPERAALRGIVPPLVLAFLRCIP